MSLTPEHLIIIGLSFLLFVAILIILYLLKKNNGSYGENFSSSDYVKKDVHKKILKERDELQVQVDNLKKKQGERGIIQGNYDYQEKYENACVEIGSLKCKIAELTRENNELNVLYHKDSLPNGVNEKFDIKNQEIEQSLEQETVQKRTDGKISKYSSFPRSAGSTIYFSDLTDKLVDDSYFELRISSDKGKASFRPLDFMKIRNYDPAMAAILTEGVKPNVASSVVKVEMGEACLEGNDWIIKKLAKVRLA